jgi:hypothetical protein
MKTRSLPVVVLLCLCAYRAAATEIVVIRSQDAIFLGSDSAETGKDGTTQVCKIGQQGHVFFAARGFVKWDHNSAGLHFDAMILASVACFGGGVLLDKVKKFEFLLRQAYPKTVQDYEESEHKQLEQAPLTMFFVAIESGTPILYQREVRLLSPPSRYTDIELQSVTDCPGKDCLDNRALLRLSGDRLDEVTAYLNVNHQHLQSGFYLEPIETIRSIIHVAADAAAKHATKTNPASVGPPIVILKMAKGQTAEWVTEKGQCPEITPYPMEASGGSTQSISFGFYVAVLAAILVLFVVARRSIRQIVARSRRTQ